MKINIAASYELMSARAAQEAAGYLQSTMHPLFCAASGNSPLGLYRQMVKRYRENLLDIASWYFLGLDEWIGMNSMDEGSCGFLVEQELIHPLEVPGERTCFFDGRSADPKKECERVEAFIQQRGGIEVAIVGVGMNGHIGLNEPGTPAALRSHVSLLDPLTSQVGQKYFNRPTPLTHGITLGLATLMDAHHLILVVNGEQKASVVKQLVEGKVSEQLPGTLLREHPSFSIYLDAGAASLLS